MAIDFVSPSYRAAQSDLTISISPLGLVELSDEEFEVHGPRLNRYATNWAFYLGHHWAYRRPQGEAQLTFNYVRAFADYINNFTFGQGVRFELPKVTEAIIGPLLHRVWETDNDKRRVLWDMGNQGGVTGDCFVKVAYEEPSVDPIGRLHPGRVRILVLNSSHCFPEWHPHDRERLSRFKLKYRFWGCHRTDVEALTRRGWKRHDEILPDDELLTIDPVTDEIQWQQHQGVSVYDYDGEMVEWRGRVDASATPNHRWLGELPTGERRTIHGEFVTTDTPVKTRLVVGGGTPLEFRSAPKYSDELVESVAWYVCDGSDHVNQTGYRSIHLEGKKPHKVAAWRRLAKVWTEQGATWREGKTRENGQATFYLGKGVVGALQEAAPGKQITPEFLTSLTYAQAVLFHDTLLAADGSTSHRGAKTSRWTQVDEARKDSYQMLCAMLGIRTNRYDPDKVQEYASRYVGTRNLNEERVHYTGKVWCPTVPTGYFMARRNGNTYWTGNTAAEGTRQVFTYTEILTDAEIVEYVNDEMLPESPRPNPIGMLPVVHIANVPVTGSPWGLADVQDIVGLNREYNEKATDISDIINYHAEPVTIVTGAKINQLEAGSNKVWGGLPADAKVYNLEVSQQGVQAALAYMAMLKQAMHEMTGVPETALGQRQPISNTSGVALAIQFQPLMNRWNLKTTQYGGGIKKINELVVLTLAVKEPQSLIYDPNVEADLKPGQYPQLDPADPLIYQSEVVFPPPLPTDILIVLNEIQARMALGLESKTGALRELGEQYPEEKLAEIMEELKQDAIDQGALDLMRASIMQTIMGLTGMVPEGGDVTSVGANDGDQKVTQPGRNEPRDAGGRAEADGGQYGPLPGIQVGFDPASVQQELVERAFGTKLAQRRMPDNDA